jgi:hypothetical protein
VGVSSDSAQANYWTGQAKAQVRDQFAKTLARAPQVPLESTFWLPPAPAGKIRKTRAPSTWSARPPCTPKIVIFGRSVGGW